MKDFAHEHTWVNLGFAGERNNTWGKVARICTTCQHSEMTERK